MPQITLAYTGITPFSHNPGSHDPAVGARANQQWDCATICFKAGFDMDGKTASVVGTGKIGKAVIDILLGLGMRVLAFDVFPDRKYAEEKV